MVRKIPLLLALAFFSVATAHAGILDIRGGVGRSSADTDDFDDEAKAANGNGIDANDFQTYNADVFINFPALPFGVGIRHEWFNLNEGSGGSDLDLEATNLSLLVDWRIIDSSRFYVGPLVAVGYPSGNVHFKSGNVTTDTDVDGDNVSYAGALEAGVYLGHFLIGAEAGYQNVEFKSSSDNNGGSAKFDASGFYGKVLAGLTFF